jgi:hypothetical protein
MFDKSLTGHTSSVIQIKNRKQMLVFGGFNGINYNNRIYAVNLGKVFLFNTQTIFASLILITEERIITRSQGAFIQVIMIKLMIAFLFMEGGTEISCTQKLKILLEFGSMI